MGRRIYCFPTSILNSGTLHIGLGEVTMGKAPEQYTSRTQLARYGERLAAAYLESVGVRILEMNIYIGPDELDILAEHGSELLVVEVKSRSSQAFGDGAEAVGAGKLHRMRRAATCWLAAGDEIYSAIRFFVVEVNVHEHPHRLTVCEVEGT